MTSDTFHVHPAFSVSYPAFKELPSLVPGVRPSLLLGTDELILVPAKLCRADGRARLSRSGPLTLVKIHTKHLKTTAAYLSVSDVETYQHKLGHIT